MQLRHLVHNIVIGFSILAIAGTPQILKAESAAPPGDGGSASHPAEASAIAKSEIDAYVNHVLRSFNVPGIGLTIVKDGKVVLEKGYGVRDLATGAPVDSHTLFAIASNTKAFTAASLEMLADKGKLDMDDRVIKYLPWFRMSNTYVTHEMRVHDLLAHDSGLPKGQTTDLLFTPDSDYSGKEVAEHLADVPLGYSFRSRTAYDNILYGVAALVVEKVSGEGFRQFLKSHIFEPLGMRDTRFNYHYAGSSGHDDVATGYVPFGDPFRTPQGELRPAHKMAWNNCTGAAGIYSSAHDMAKWVMAQIAGGVYGGGQGDKPKRLFSESSHKRMWTLQSITTPDKEELRIASKIPALAGIAPDYDGFGEGWHLSQYHERKMVYHTGGWPGFVSRVTIIPSLRLGIVVLTNQRSGGAFNAVTNHILDAYMGIRKTDWVGAYLKANDMRQQRKKKKWDAFRKARVEDSGPSLPISDYAGTYHSWYGDVDIRKSQKGLVIQFSHTHRLVGRLTHWSHDTFEIHWNDRMLRADAYITFDLTPEGKIKDARMASSPRYLFSYMFDKLQLTPVKQEKDGGRATKSS